VTDSILLITAHPDDVAYACGGTAWMLKQRFRLHVVCASQGERGHPDGAFPPGSLPPGTLPPPSPAIAAVRAQEEAASCALLGADLTFLGLVDGEIFPTPAACATVAEMIRRLRPRAVLTHGAFEKKDHSAVFAIAYQSLFLAERFWETELCMFWQPDGTYNLHTPPIYVDISPVIERKRELIRCHRSHLHGDTTVESLIERNRHLGKLALCDYAEAFYTPLPMANRRWGRPAECGRTILEL
jgi:LmbE family N-acetylglucosaminyl deacetylase